VVAPVAREPLRILIVEERADVRLAAETVCRQIGLLPIGADGTEAALAMIAGNDSVDLLLTDMDLPGAIGAVELVERAKRKRPHLLVILTSTAMPTVSIQDREVFILRKPYSIREFEAVLTNNFHLRL
jgi:CheY-like chemotaxis protein